MAMVIANALIGLWIGLTVLALTVLVLTFVVFAVIGRLRRSR